MKISVFLIFLLTLGISTMAQNTIIAHRGASHLAPENTVASVKLAWELGADAVEIDVHLSRDNRVMVIHDEDTKRTCNGKKNLTIKDAPSVILRDLDAGIWKGDEFKGEKIPFLSEVLETVPEGKTLVVEIKSDTKILPALQRVLEDNDKRDQIVFISFGWKTILQTRKAFPDNKCYWLSSSKSGLKKKMEDAAKKGLDGVNLKHSMINEEIMALAKQLDLDVLTWTVDDPAEAQRLLKLGVSGITTNRPKWLKDQMEKQ